MEFRIHQIVSRLSAIQLPRPFSIRDVYPVMEMVTVTHAVKDKVKSALSESDYKSIGCHNPDIWVHGKVKKSKKPSGKGHASPVFEDSIVLTPSKTHRSTGNKSGKHVTSLRASEVLGEDWEDMLPPLKFHKITSILDVAVLTLPAEMSKRLRESGSIVIVVESGVRHAALYIPRSNPQDRGQLDDARALAVNHVRDRIRALMDQRGDAVISMHAHGVRAQLDLLRAANLITPEEFVQLEEDVLAAHQVAVRA